MGAGRRRAPRALAVLPLLLVSPPPSDLGSEPTISGPVVSSNRDAVDPGDRVILTIDGYTSPFVTITVCGNEARRGSPDCDVASSVANEFNDSDKPMVLEFVVTEPPADCPCVIRVVGRDATEIAISPVVIVGHAVGPLVDAPSISDLMSVSVGAREVPANVLAGLRAAVGGPATFEVTVTVRNTSTAALRQVTASGSAGRQGDIDDLVTLDLEDPGLIGVGQTWQQTVSALVPAPSFGTIEWRVTVSGAGPTVRATSTTEHRPVLLIVLLMIVVVNVFFVLIRWRARRRSTRAAAQALAGADGGDGGVADDAASTVVEESQDVVAATT